MYEHSVGQHVNAYAYTGVCDNMNMMIMQSLVERLRPLVGLNGWDYCVLWKLREDQRFIEWSGCCCAGADQTTQNAGEELLFPLSSVVPCRDSELPHPRTNPCALLSQLPSSIPLDSGTYAQSLMTNQVHWLNDSNSTVSEFIDEAIGTRVFIPVFGGLVELFVNKQVPEDRNVIDFVTSQCNLLMEQDVFMNSANMDKSFLFNANSMSNILSNPFLGSENDAKAHLTTNQHVLWSHDSLLLDKQMNPLMKSNGSDELQDMEGFEKYMMSNTRNSLERKEEQGDDRDSVKQELGKSDSVSGCSDQLEDEDDVKCRRRNGKGPSSKNLVAERNRRKKLNDRLYALRALVPKISKLDRASILGDAIDFVKELQKQAQELKDELDDNSDHDGARSNNCINGHLDNLTQTGSRHLGHKLEYDKTPTGFHLGISGNDNFPKQNQELDNSVDRTEQMEPQVEVALIEGNEFFVKVFCEHKPGGFSKLMDAFESLRMEVTNANVTSHKGLVSHVFKIEKKDSEIVQAEDVRDSLLEITRNPHRAWTDIAKGSDNAIGMDYNHHDRVANQPLSPYQHHQLHQLQG